MQKNIKITLILITAMNLRLAVTAVTPLFSAIQRTLHVDSTLTVPVKIIELSSRIQSNRFCFAL